MIWLFCQIVGEPARGEVYLLHSAPVVVVLGWPSRHGLLRGTPQPNIDLRSRPQHAVNQKVNSCAAQR